MWLPVHSDEAKGPIGAPSSNTMLYFSTSLPECLVLLGLYFSTSLPGCLVLLGLYFSTSLPECLVLLGLYFSTSLSECLVLLGLYFNTSLPECLVLLGLYYFQHLTTWMFSSIRVDLSKLLHCYIYWKNAVKEIVYYHYMYIHYTVYSTIYLLLFKSTVSAADLQYVYVYWVLPL